MVAYNLANQEVMLEFVDSQSRVSIEAKVLVETDNYVLIEDQKTKRTVAVPWGAIARLMFKKSV